MVPYDDLLKEPRTWGRVLGIITCKSLREDRKKKLFDAVDDTIGTRDFCDFICNSKLHLTVTGGSYDRLRQAWKNHPELLDRTTRAEESASGIIQLANLVIFGFCRAILFFNDAEDIYADSPQNLALRRLCNEFNVPLVEDIASIRYVLAKWYGGDDFATKTPRSYLSPKSYPEDEIKRYFGHDSKLIFDPAESMAARNRDNETLAVIAHDDRKMEMLRFCAKHAREILCYRRVLTTGTTGEKLSELYKELLRIADQNVQREIGRAPDETIESFIDRKICPFLSGPKGGDIQISAKVVDGSCHRVLFFEDPGSAHAHQFDIRLLEKAVQNFRTATLFATSTEMAELIV